MFFCFYLITSRPDITFVNLILCGLYCCTVVVEYINTMRTTIDFNFDFFQAVMDKHEHGNKMNLSIISFSNLFLVNFRKVVFIEYMI